MDSTTRCESQSVYSIKTLYSTTSNHALLLRGLPGRILGSQSLGIRILCEHALRHPGLQFFDILPGGREVLLLMPQMSLFSAQLRYLDAFRRLRSIRAILAIQEMPSHVKTTTTRRPCIYIIEVTTVHSRVVGDPLLLSTLPTPLFKTSMYAILTTKTTITTKNRRSTNREMIR